MASLLSNLVNNIADGIHIIKCKQGHDNKKCETQGIKYKNCKCFLEYTNFKDNLIKKTNVYGAITNIKKSLVKN